MYLKRLARLLLGSLLLILAVAACSPAAAEPEVTVVFFDVGDAGDGFLVSTREGKHMLIDGGGRSSGILNALKARKVSRIDVLVATNPDADHIGGLISVLKAMPVGEVWLSGDANTTITFEDFLKAVHASNAAVHSARRGDVIQLGSLSVPVLNPAGRIFPDRNNNSVALRLAIGSVSFLFTGDMEAEAEARLVQSEINLRSTVLKLGHHGSRTSTSAPFLAAVRPKVAVYQAGHNNRNGHPHPETLAALANAGVTVYGTGKNGVIVITTDGKTYQVKTDR